MAGSGICICQGKVRQSKAKQSKVDFGTSLLTNPLPFIILPSPSRYSGTPLHICPFFPLTLSFPLYPGMLPVALSILVHDCVSHRNSLVSAHLS